MEDALSAIENRADAFAFDALPGELAVFPGGGEILEAVRGDLMIGGIGGLAFGRIHGWTFDRAAAGGKDGFGMLLVHQPEHLVEPVDAPVAKLAIRVVKKLAEAQRVDFAIKRTKRRGPAPGFPVQPRGNVCIGARSFGAAAG